VASQEGRVVMMTTSHVDQLDEALIRPGRVNLRVEFGLADNTIIAQIFSFIYGSWKVAIIL
jgi:mitochondrial chaperone BCS1